MDSVLGSGMGSRTEGAPGLVGVEKGLGQRATWPGLFPRQGRGSGHLLAGGPGQLRQVGCLGPHPASHWAHLAKPVLLDGCPPTVPTSELGMVASRPRLAPRKEPGG